VDRHKNAAARRIGLEHFSRQDFHEMCCCTKHVYLLKATCTRNMRWGWIIFEATCARKMRCCTQHVHVFKATCARKMGSCTQHMHARNMYTCARVACSHMPHETFSRAHMYGSSYGSGCRPRFSRNICCFTPRVHMYNMCCCTQHVQVYIMFYCTQHVHV
jgi:hypothetical protein